MAPGTWPSETELVMSSRNKVNLSSQRPVICVVLKEAIELVRLSLLFDHAFPDPKVALDLARDSVVKAAKKYRPSTSTIYERLHSDDEYLSKMASVVRIIFLDKYLTEIICSRVLAFH
jgi:hypothetical protein